jgi:outer membrane protein TolC
MKIPSIVFTLLLCAVFATSAWTAEEPPQLTQLLNEADSGNPSLLAAFEQIAVAESKIDQVTSLPDPVLSFALSNYPLELLFLLPVQG